MASDIIESWKASA